MTAPSSIGPVPVLFMGTPEFAVPSLLALLRQPERYRVVAVVTQPDRPAGRKRKLTPSAVRQAAEAHGLAVLTPKRMRHPETRAQLMATGAQLFVVAAYGRILPPQLLDVPALGCINVHASLLPRFRGASPIARAIWAGDAEAGVCIMGMEEGLDTGPVFARASVAVEPNATCGSLTAQLAEVGAEALMQALPDIVSGTARPTPQPQLGISQAPPLRKEDGLLTFAEDAAAVCRQVRALDPWPGCYTFLGAQRVGVLQAEVAPSDGPTGQTHSPGEVLQATSGGLVVACGQGCLRITQVKPAGRGQMTAAAWISGRGPKKGAILKPLPEEGSQPEGQP